jgi:hypothetical protein
MNKFEDRVFNIFTIIVFVSIVCAFFYSLFLLFERFRPSAVDDFWYPIMHSHVYCGNFETEVITLAPVKGWASYRIFVEKNGRRELKLSNACVHQVIKKWPKASDREDLDAEQLKYLIEGF